MKQQQAVFAGMVLILLLTGFGIIKSKHHSRQLFIAIQQHEQRLDQQAVEWGRLQLELSTLTEANRVESLAVERLSMTLPKRDQIVYLKPRI